MLLYRSGAVRMHGDFGQMAVVIRIGPGFAAVQIPAEGLELNVVHRERRVRFIFFAGEMGIPRRQAGAASNPQAVGFGRVDIVIFDQAQLAGGLILVQRQHGDRRRQRAVGVAAFLVARGVFELDHGEDRLALDARHGRIGQRQQGSAVRRIRKELAFLAGHRFVDDRLVVDVDVAAGENRAAFAVRHRIARHEERLIRQFVALRAVVGEAHVEAGADRGGCHGGGIAQREGVHRSEGHRGIGLRCAGAGAGAQERRGGQRAERQHGRGGQEFKCATARGLGHSGRIGHSGFSRSFDWRRSAGAIRADGEL